MPNGIKKGHGRHISRDVWTLSQETISEDKEKEGQKIMYQIEYDGKVLTPILDADEAHYWAARLGEFLPRRSAQIIEIDNGDWLTANLPATTGPRIERLGAELGVIV